MCPYILILHLYFLTPKIGVLNLQRCKTCNKYDFQKHTQTCKYIEIDNIIDKIRKEHQNEIDHLKNTYEKRLEQFRTKTECMEKEQERMTSLLEKVVTKPLVTNNTNTTNNTIKGNNNNLQSFLASPELYEKQVDPDRIKSIDHSIIEKHFWLGQKGIARFCVDNIINTTDEEGNHKMLLYCSDTSRKRFKYVDDDNHLVDDMEARHFIDTVSEPIVTVCRKVYDGVLMGNCGYDRQSAERILHHRPMA